MTGLSIITKVDLFELMKAFFTDSAKWNKFTQSAKKPHFFMWRRMMSIQYPIQMNALSGLDDVRMMDALHKVFCTGAYPQWMYTRTGGDTVSKNKKDSILKKYTRDVIDTFMEQYSFEWSTMLQFEEMNPTLLYTELNIIESELHPAPQKQKSKRNTKKKV